MVLHLELPSQLLEQARQLVLLIDGVFKKLLNTGNLLAGLGLQMKFHLFLLETNLICKAKESYMLS
ncbi:hypothetical protein B566_EDAN011885 [Ephemera danica]|nr:hypothetical protein B566_EDAN011885 [Ephemera danica]